MALEPISIPESSRLIELENIIREGQHAWLEVGIALTEIKEKRLYRNDYETFAEYCRCVWQWTDRRAYQLIAAADEVGTTGSDFKTERAARAARAKRIKQDSTHSPASPSAELPSYNASKSPADASGIQTAGEHSLPDAPKPRPIDADLVEAMGGISEVPKAGPELRELTEDEENALLALNRAMKDINTLRDGILKGNITGGSIAIWVENIIEKLNQI